MPNTPSENIWTNSEWVMRPEVLAKEIEGDLVLGNDILIYFKMCAYEQGVLDRIAKTPDYTLADEIKSDTGFVILGNPEQVRGAMHTWVDGIVNAILEQRSKKNG